MNWKRCDSVRAKIIGGCPRATLFSVFTPHHKKWPRISISIYDYFEPNQSFLLSCNIKRARDTWWEECEIPNELIFEVQKLLEKYINMKHLDRP